MFNNFFCVQKVFSTFWAISGNLIDHVVSHVILFARAIKQKHMLPCALRKINKTKMTGSACEMD